MQHILIAYLTFFIRFDVICHPNHNRGWMIATFDDLENIIGVKGHIALYLNSK